MKNTSKNLRKYFIKFISKIFYIIELIIPLTQCKPNANIQISILKELL